MLALRSRGGLHAPDIHKYYYATPSCAVISWSSRYPPNRWSEIEMSITSPVHPCYGQLSQNICLNWGICFFSPDAFYSIWKYFSNRFSLSSTCPPLLKVLVKPDIPNNLSYSRLLPWTQAAVFQTRSVINVCPLQNFKFNTTRSSENGAWLWIYL